MKVRERGDIIAHKKRQREIERGRESKAASYIRDEERMRCVGLVIILVLLQYIKHSFRMMKIFSSRTLAFPRRHP